MSCSILQASREHAMLRFIVKLKSSEKISLGSSQRVLCRRHTSKMNTTYLKNCVDKQTQTDDESTILQTALDEMKRDDVILTTIMKEIHQTFMEILSNRSVVEQVCDKNKTNVDVACKNE